MQINSYNIIAATEENVPREGSKALPKEVKKGFNGLNLKGSRKTSGVKNSFGRKGIIWALHDIVDVIWCLWPIRSPTSGFLYFSA